MWGKEKAIEKPKVEIKGERNYTPIFDFDLNSIPFLISATKMSVGGSTRLLFKTSGGIPVAAQIFESLKADGKWGYSDFAIGLVGRDERDYSLTLEVGDNVIQFYFDIGKITEAFQKLGFKIDTSHCQTYAKLQEMVEKSNNLAYLDNVQQMREKGENV